MRKINQGIYNFLNVSAVFNTPLLNDNSIRIWGQNHINVIQHYNSYLTNVNAPNSPGPIEKHPYIELYDDFFNLQNKFLILGTFPPSSYFNNLGLNGLPNPNIQPNNPVHFFYGNQNNLWNFLFNINPVNITINQIKENLIHNNISITDVFSFIQRKSMINSDDSNLKNLVLNCRVLEIFDQGSSIETILLTSGKLATFFNAQTSTLTGLKWILEDCGSNIEDFKFSGDITGNGLYYPINEVNLINVLNQQDNGIVWWIKKGDKKIKVINLPSPSNIGAARLPGSIYFSKWVLYKATVNNIPLPNQVQLQNLILNYLPLYPNIFVGPPTIQFRREIYTMALNNTIQLI
jgi:hypothetical protein